MAKLVGNLKKKLIVNVMRSEQKELTIAYFEAPS